MSEQVPSKEMISLDEVRKLYQRIEHVYDDALVPVEAGVVKRLCAEVCGLAKELECAPHEPRARDADLYEWVSGLVETLNLAGITRAEGDEHIDTDYLAELHSRLAQPPSSDEAQYAARYKQLCLNIIDAKKRAGHVFGLTLREIDQCIDDAIKMGVYSTETKGGEHG